MMNQLHQKLVFAQDLFHTSENAMDVHRVIQLAFKETVFDMNKSPAVNEMRRVGSQGEPVAVARLSGDCHALQRDIFRKLGNHAHTGTVIDLHIAAVT